MEHQRPRRNQIAAGSQMRAPHSKPCGHLVAFRTLRVALILVDPANPCHVVDRPYSIGTLGEQLEKFSLEW
jgi:hypothetical protein